MLRSLGGATESEVLLNRAESAAVKLQGTTEWQLYAQRDYPCWFVDTGSHHARGEQCRMDLWPLEQTQRPCVRLVWF